MNLNDQHIDDLFRKAADTSKSPAYNPSYWSEMEQLLNAERKRRKGLIAWSVFGMILLFGLLSKAVTIDCEHPLTYAKIGLSVELNPDYLLEIKSDFEEFIASQKVISSEAPSINPFVIPHIKLSAEQKSANEPNKIHQTNKALTSNPLTVRSIEIDKLSSNNLTELPNTYTSGIEELGAFSKLTSFTRQLPAFSPFYNTFGVGTGLSQAYAENSQNPRILSIEWKLNYKMNRFELSSGLGLTLEKNPGITVSERARVYGFGVTNFENSLNYKTLLDISIPVQLAVIHRKNKFGAGLQLRFLANSSMLFESKANGETMEAKNLSGLTTGLNPLNVDTYVFYERGLSENIQIGARLTQQLTSRIANDQYFNNLYRKSVMNAQIYFKYTLFN